MVDPRVEKLAKLCVNYSVHVKPKENVVIQGSDLAFPLMHELYKECLLAGAYPAILAWFDTSYTFFKYAKAHQLRHVSIIDKFVIANVDVRISIFGWRNPCALSNVDPSKIRIRDAAWKEYEDIFQKREYDGTLRWCYMPFPVYSAAQEASMALSEYEDFVYDSCLVNKKDPIAEWKKIKREQEKICGYLNKANEIRIVGEDTDLTLSVKGRKWLSCHGEVNLPDGEVATGPIENSANGTIRFTYPGIYAGREVEDISLTFKNGKVIRASAIKGEDLLKEILKVENADRIGEAAIGTNYGITRFTREILFDEKMGGTIHLALGRSYFESGGLNQSGVHWDILKDMKKDGEIYADKELFYKNGKFLI
jgi:aminopeptidase